MNSLEAEFPAGKINRQHVRIGLLAALLSVVIHIGVVWILSDQRFGIAVVADALRSSPLRTKAMRLVHTEPEGRPSATRPPSLSPGDDSLAADMVRESQALSRAPEQGAMEPPAVLEGGLAGDTPNQAEPSAVPIRDRWEPRQKILVVENRIAADELPDYPRRRIEPLLRVNQANDIVVPLDRDAALAATTEAAPVEGVKTAQPEQNVLDDSIIRGVVGSGGGRPGLAMGEVGAESPARFLEETSAEVTSYRALDHFLRARITTWSPVTDFRHGYFKIEITRAGEEILPVLPKDVVLVQDCSASMTEQRLYFCRKGLNECLGLIGPDDRFNVIGFQDAVSRAFPDWVANKPEFIAQARTFIEGMRSGGNTDIFASIQKLVELPRIEGRPVVVLLVTDGRSTTGLINSSDIIGEFSKINDGAVSVFTLGTIQTADTYLLDLLSYCNRGEAMNISSGRWGIEQDLPALMKAVSRPVLSDVRFRFATGQDCEVYPVLTSNLYLDRPLVIYGRYPKGMDRVVFQAVGKAGPRSGDMLFDLPLEGTGVKDKTLRDDWALQKVYHLIGQHARRGDPALLDEIGRTARAYGVAVPHRDRL